MESKIKNKKCILKALADIKDSRVLGQQVDKNWFHPFPARMPYGVAEHLIRNTTSPGAIVLDPMAGSGTTLLAACNNGLRSYGFDMDPLAAIITRSLLNKYESSRMGGLRERILKRAKSEMWKFRLPQALENLTEEDRNFLYYWYPIQSIKQLFALCTAIEAETNDSDKSLAWAVYSSLIIAKLVGASYAIDIPRSRPHKRKNKTIVLPFDGWDWRFKRALKKLPYIDRTPGADCLIQIGDARQLPLNSETIDLILTSPPYHTSIDYLRAHKFSLVWMDYRIDELREIRGSLVGTERGLWDKDGLPHDFETKLNKSVKTNRKRAILRRYLSDLRKVLLEIHRVLKPGGLTLFVIGPTIINKKRIDAVELLSNLSESVGLRPIGNVIRKLNPNRRSLPPPQVAKQNPLSKRMRREVIIAMQK